MSLNFRRFLPGSFAESMRAYTAFSKHASEIEARARSLFPAPEHPNLLSRTNFAAIRALRPHLPAPRVIKNRDGASDYLEWTYLRGQPSMTDGSSPFDAYGQPVLDKRFRWPDEPVQPALHHFLRSDEDHELHNHPFAWSFSIVLVGGYREERRRWTGERFAIDTKDVVAGQINVILATTYHRVDLLYPETWILFVMGPRTGEDWSFWDRETGETTPHGEFLEKKRLRRAVANAAHPYPRGSCRCGHDRGMHVNGAGPCRTANRGEFCRCGCFISAASQVAPVTHILRCLCGHPQSMHREFTGGCLTLREDGSGPCGCRGFAESRIGTPEYRAAERETASTTATCHCGHVEQLHGEDGCRGAPNLSTGYGTFGRNRCNCPQFEPSQVAP